MPRNQVRFGLVGYGLFGRHHARSISNHPDASLVAIAVPSEASQQAAKSDYPQADIYGDYRQLVARDDIDVVDVVVPNWQHYRVGLDALQAGKHLLLEKPMALEVAHCDELIALAAIKGRMLAIGHELRLSHLWGRIQTMIGDGVIGHPQYALVELSRFPYRQGSGGWRYDLARVGNWILEEPIHFFDLARWYLAPCGDPISVYARANARRADQPGLRDNLSCIVNFADGGYALVTQSLSAFGHHQTVKVSGTEGTIWGDWSGADARTDEPRFGLRYGLGEEVTEIRITQRAGELVELADEIGAVVRSLQDDSPIPCTGEDGRWSTALCLAAQKSADTGEMVELRPND